MRLRIGLLGPFELRVDGALVSVSSARRRALLAALALRAGQMVPAESLAEFVWGERPPTSVAASLYTLVNRTRQTVGADLIVTESPGYRLAVPADAVDALRMQRLVAGADSLPVAQARDTLAEAVALWRGQPLRDCGSPLLERQMRRVLTECYLSALEKHVDFGLSHGLATPMLERLERAAVEHPLREPLWARLIIALDAAGQPAHAEEAYELIRGRLAEELGTDPAPELRDAHVRLSDRPERVPRQLPPGIARFVGRARYLADLNQLLMRHKTGGLPTIAAIHGAGGVGKTSLALHWAHQVGDQFPDGHLYLDMHGYGPAEPRTPVAALSAILRTLGEPAEGIPVDLADLSALVRARLAGRRVLLVLDNVRDADQVGSLLVGHGGFVLVTSRNELPELSFRDGVTRLAMAEMSSAEATELVANALGADRVAAELDRVTELVALCGRLPLALVIAVEQVARCRSAPIEQLVTQLRACRNRLTSLSAFNDPTVNLRTVFSWSYQALSPEGMRAFRHMGRYPRPDFGLTAAVELIGLPVAETRRLLNLLVTAHLLEQDEPGRYRFPDLLWLYAREQAETEDPADRPGRDLLDDGLVPDHRVLTGVAVGGVVPGRESLLSRLFPHSWVGSG